MSVIAYTVGSLGTSSAELQRIVDQNLAVERLATTLRATILELGSEVWEAVALAPDDRGNQLERLEARTKAFHRTLGDLSVLAPELGSDIEALGRRFQDSATLRATMVKIPSLSSFLSQPEFVDRVRADQDELASALEHVVLASKSHFLTTLADLNAGLRSVTVSAFALAGLVTLLSFTVALLLSRRLARPLELLTQTARLVSSGDFTVRPQPAGPGEMGALTGAFVSMLDQIEGYSGRMEDLVSARTEALARTNAVLVRELKLAQKIQGALVPRTFPGGGPLEAAGVYLPMDELGGDFYDLTEGSPGIWSVVMADVSGHGVPAALVTAMVKISLGVHGSGRPVPGRVVDEVNRELFAAIGDLKRYVTMVHGVLDLEASTLSFCNAGHNEFLVVRNTGKVEVYGPNSGVVGRYPDELYLTRTIPFGPGDLALLFTDGLVETRGADRTVFSLERLIDLVDRHRGLAPPALVKVIQDEVRQFATDRLRQDDVAILAVRRRALGSPWAEGDKPRAPEDRDGWSSGDQAIDLYHNREYRLLIRWAADLLATRPDPRETARILHWKAMAHTRLGEIPEALMAWDRALVADPGHHRARRNLDLLRRHLQEVAGDR